LGEAVFIATGGMGASAPIFVLHLIVPLYRTIPQTCFCFDMSGGDFAEGGGADNRSEKGEYCSSRFFEGHFKKGECNTCVEMSGLKRIRGAFGGFKTGSWRVWRV